MSIEANPPSIEKKSFDCPHCGAFAAQSWFTVLVAHRQGAGLPFSQSKVFAMTTGSNNAVQDAYAGGMFAQKLPFFAQSPNASNSFELINASASRCHACSKVAFWSADRLVFPTAKVAFKAHPDMPPDIARDFDEASAILQISPRGAAALLRLCVQKLCKELGEQGEDINADIGKLVGKGLNPTIQKALDVVRVVGNESVHPGSMDLRDDVATASALLKIVNVITEQMIAQPKMIDELFTGLPARKLAGIERRDSAERRAKA